MPKCEKYRRGGGGEFFRGLLQSVFLGDMERGRGGERGDFWVLFMLFLFRSSDFVFFFSSLFLWFPGGVSRARRILIGGF